jgi:hypothetical protein
MHNVYTPPHAQISGHDANSPAAGPLFNIPVCVIVPESPQHEDSTASPGLNYVFKVNKHAHGMAWPTPKIQNAHPRRGVTSRGIMDT